MAAEPVVLDVAEFSLTPGGRYKHEGKFSGEEYRERFVEPILEAGGSVIIDLDGPEGFQSSFLEELFGGLVRKYGKVDAMARVSPRAVLKPWRQDKALTYMEDA